MKRNILIVVAVLGVGCGQVVAAGFQAGTSRPNVLIVLADDQRFDTVGVLGHAVVKTPNLDMLADSAFVFRNAYCFGSNVGAVCLPSRNMLLSGRVYFRWCGDSLKAKPAPADGRTLPEVFATAGYETYHYGKTGNTAPLIQAKFDHNLYFESRTEQTDEPGREVMDGAIAFLKRRDRKRPFLMYLAPFAPHDPRWAAPRFQAPYCLEEIPLPENFLPVHPFDNGDMAIRDEALAPWPRTPHDVRLHLKDYYATITGLDHHIGRLIEALKALGEYENTVIAFASDNGLSMSSHGLLGKQNLYDHGSKVPLILTGPGVPQGESPALVYLHDLMPTLCELAGVPVPEGLDGRSLIPVLDGSAEGVRDTLFAAYKDLQRSLRDNRWKVIRYPKIHRTQLYDLEADPEEMRDLASCPEHAPRIEAMLARMRAWQREVGDTVPLSAAEREPEDWMPPPRAVQDERRHKAYRNMILGRVGSRVGRMASTLQKRFAGRPGAADVTRYAGKVHTGTWTELWPGRERQPQKHDVTGEIWSDAVEAALATAGGVLLPKRQQPYYLDRPIVLKSGQFLIADPEAEIRLKPGANTCMVRNEHIVGFHDGPVPADLAPDRDILVEGGIWTTLCTGPGIDNGNKRGRSDAKGGVEGCHGVILLQNIRGAVVRNLTIRQSRPFGVHIGGTEFLVEHIRFEDHGRDGVHIEGPSSFAIVRNISGTMRDDPVALNAWDWQQYSLAWGPIHHILVENIRGAPESAGSYDSIRLLPGVKRFPDGATLDCPVYDIVIRDVKDIYDFKLYNQPNLELGRNKDFSAGIGRLRNIYFENLTLSRPGTFHIHADTEGLSIRDVRLNFPLQPDYRLVEIGPLSQTYKRRGSEDPSNWTEIFSPDLDCTVRDLHIANVRAKDAVEGLPIDRLVRVIEQKINLDYPKTTPRGGTGKGTWVKDGG